MFKDIFDENVTILSPRPVIAVAMLRFYDAQCSLYGSIVYTAGVSSFLYFLM